MGKPYIYYISSNKTPNIMYIGQSMGNDGRYARVLSHFSGLYHYNKNGAYVNTQGNAILEGTPLVDWLKGITLDSVEVQIFEGPDFGIPQNVWIEFWSQWATSPNFKDKLPGNLVEQKQQALDIFNKLNDEQKLNAAEIIHIYNAKKHGQILVQTQMGGQNLNLFKRGSNIVLNREMSPTQMQTLLDAHTGSIEKMQQIFDEMFHKYVLNNPLYIERISDAKIWTSLESKNTSSAGYKMLRSITDDFLQEPQYGSVSRLDAILNEVADECGHENYFRVSWGEKLPENRRPTFYRQKRNDSYDTLIDALTSQLKSKAKTINQNKNDKDISTILKDLIENGQINVSVGTIMDIKLLISYNGLSSFNATGSFIDISSNLKMMSYYYFAHWAQQYFNENTFSWGRSRWSDSEGNRYARINGKLCINYIWLKYQEEGIINGYTENYETFRTTFGRQMLTLYTKNRGSISGNPLVMEEVFNLNDTTDIRKAGVFDVPNIGIEDGKIVYLAYFFSDATYDYMSRILTGEVSEDDAATVANVKYY